MSGSVLRTRRLLLRPYRPADAAALLPIYSREDVARYLLDDPWTPAKAREEVTRRADRVGLDSPARSLALVVEDEDGAVLGDVALWSTDPAGRTAEVGWVLSPEAGGRGIATEAASAVIAHAFDQGVHRLEAQMDARNDRSARLAERLGMRREAHFRQNWWMKGEWTDTLVFALLASDRHGA